MVEGRKEGRKGREKEVERIREWTAEAEESRIWPIRNPLVCAQIGCYLSAVEDTEPHKGTRGCATHTQLTHTTAIRYSKASEREASPPIPTIQVQEEI